MFTLLLIIHVVACLLIIFFVLLQSGRGAELGAAFGGVGQANSVRGEMTGVGKITTGVAIVFMLTSLSLAYLSSETTKDSDEIWTYEYEVPMADGDGNEPFALRVVCDPKSYLYLNGTTIDFKDEIMGRGFVFNNPNATNTCGCGSSFSA